MPFERRWITAAEASNRLGCSRKTILNKISAGQIPASHPPGLGCRVDWKGVESIYAEAEKGRNHHDQGKRK